MNKSLAKIPPQAIELEKAVLGAILLEKDAIDQVIDVLKPGCFYLEAHNLIFNAILNLYSQTQAIDLLTVTAELTKMSSLAKIGGVYYLTELTDRVVSSANIIDHSRIVLQKFIAREYIKCSAEAINDCYNEEVEITEIISKSQFQIDELTSKIVSKRAVSSKELYDQNIERLLKIHNTPNGITGIRSGFKDLDQITGGWQASDLIIIAARPGMGKTSIVLSSAINSGIYNNVPGAIFSLEMSSYQLMDKITSIVSGVPLELFKKGTLTDSDWTKIQNVSEQIKNSPIKFDDTPSLSVMEFAAKARTLKRQNNIQWIVIDYMQLMVGKNIKGSNREQEIGSIARTLKAVAKELNIPVIALSQLSRAVESRADKRPMLSDLRESGSIEQDADIVCFLYRSEYYHIDTDENGISLSGVSEFIVAKHRNGPTAEIVLQFNKETTGFYDDNPYDFQEIIKPDYQIGPF